MKHLVLSSFSGVERVGLVNDKFEPELSSGQVLIKIEAAGINGSDLMMIDGHYAIRPELPAGIGAEGVGRVEKAGKGASHLEGKRVVILPTYEQTTWAEYTVASQQNVVEVSDKADVLQLAMLGVNPPTAYMLLKQFADLMPGDWIGQTGGNSAVGQYVIQLAKLAGVKTLNVVRSPEAAEKVKAYGGDQVVIQGETLTKQIEAALGGQQLSGAFDPVGGPSIGELAKFLKYGGVAVAYGLTSGQPQKVSPLDLIFRGVGLHGFWLINWIRNTPRSEVQSVYNHLADLIAQGKLHADIDSTYTLDQYSDAFEHAKKHGRNGKVLFRF